MPETHAFDRLAVVTGTTSGIGEAVARQLLEREWRVVGLARREPVIHHDCYEHVSIDLADTRSLLRTIEPRLEALLNDTRWRRVGLVNNAAHGGLAGPLAHIHLDQLPDVFATNCIAPICLMGQFARRTPVATPLRIVNVSSGAAVRGYAGLGAYGTSKAALRMAGMVLAAEVEEKRSRGADSDVSILSFEPGTVDTPMQEAARSSPRERLPSVDLFVNFAADGRLVDPSAPAADIVAFLEGDGEALFTERRYAAR